MTAPLHPNESERLKALESFEILDTPAEASYDELVALAAEICGTPIALISLVDKDRQWFKAKVGLDARETSREVAFCAHCILGEEILEVPNATEDDRFKSNPLVTSEPNIRFYAGAPLITSSGHALGSLCVISPEVKTLTDSQKKALRTLSNQVCLQLQLRLANKHLAERQKELSRSNQSLQQLFRIIAHDLRAPFQGFLGITELLEESYEQFTAADVRKFIEMLGESASETYNLLENLLEWSTLEVGSLAYTPETISALELIDKSICLLSTSLGKKHITLSKDIPSAVNIHADSKMISSVVRNLVYNAIKFTRESGLIKIRGKIENDRLRITITDNGIGLTKEQLKTMLQRGSINSSLGTAGEHGSGIGLHLIHNFLERHDTELHIVSNESDGTAASFSIALA